MKERNYRCAICDDDFKSKRDPSKVSCPGCGGVAVFTEPESPKTEPTQIF